MSANMIKVAIKVRPLIPREKSTRTIEQWTVKQNSIVSLHQPHTSTYHFDHVFTKESRNRDVFEKIAHPIVRQSLDGLNATIFAYGQTSSGKTHTMLGNDEDPGITVLAVRQLFEESPDDRTFMIRVGYIEIYNEKVYDLLKDRTLVAINQNGGNDIKLTNKEVIVKDGDTILNIFAHGNKLRKAAQTNMNEASSRSHAIFRIIIESADASGDGPVRVSYLNLVDLAGSEKAIDAGASVTRLQEGKDINKSLLQLGIVIRALSDGEKVIDFRSSKLTRILQASLGGNANTAIICNIAPAAIGETASTLGFATQAKTVKTKAKCNEVFTPEEALMKQMQAEMVRLKAELQENKENEKQLRAKIAQKEATFLTGRKSISISKLESELNEKVKNELSAKDVIESLEFQLRSSQQNVSELKAELQLKQKKIEGGDQIISKLESELNEKVKNELSAKDKIESLESQLRSNQQNVSELKAELQLKQKNIEGGDQIISKLESELNEKVKNELSAKDKIESLESQLRSNQQNVSELKAELQLKQKNIEGGDQIISKLESELNEKVKNELSAKDKIESLESQLRSNQQNVSELKAELQLKQKNIEGGDQIISKLESELNKKVKNELSAKDKIESLESQLSTYPKKNQTVFVHYTGTLENGTVFDSSRTRGKPFKFCIGKGEVIRGWDEGVAKMSVGERAKLVCSPDYAYGSRGHPGVIPPNAVLTFDVELLKLE